MGDTARETIVLLHGFGGTRHAWDGVVARLDGERYRPLALDLPGHGEAGSVRPVSFAASVALVLDHAPERFALAGYSMGGRVALHVALTAPQRVLRMVLVATTAGLPQEAARAARRAADERLARELESGSYAGFIRRWRDQPLFAGDPPHVRALASADQARNRPGDVAAALRGLGTGVMTPLWGRLGELRMPVILLAGERDQKFLALAQRLASALPAARVVRLPGGHALLLECPSEVAAALQQTD